MDRANDRGMGGWLERTGPGRIVAVLVSIKLVFFAFLLFYNPEAFYSADTITYLQPAEDLVARGTFSVGGNPELFRTPGYSLFLAPFVALFGPSQVHFAIPMQILLGAAMGLLVHQLLLELYGSRAVARLGLIITLVDPAVFVGELSLLTELLFAFLVVSGVWMVARYARGGGWGALLVGMGIIAGSAYVRPVSIYLGYGLGVVLLLRAVWRREARGMAAAVVALVLCFGVLQLWVERNRSIFGEPIFSSVQGSSLYHYTAAGVYAKATGESYQAVQQRFMQDLVSPNRAVQARYEEKKAKEILAAHPVALAKVLAKGLAINMFDPGLGVLSNMLGLRKAQSGILFKFYDLPLGEFLVYLLSKERALIVTMGLGGLWIVFFWAAVTGGGVAERTATRGG